MAELDPRIEKVRRIGIGVFVALAVAAIPIGVHIVKTYESPELWLTLLGAVFMLPLICLYALETALLPIPKPNTQTPSSIDPDAITEMHEPDGDGPEAQTEYHEPVGVPDEPELTETLGEIEQTEALDVPELTEALDGRERTGVGSKGAPSAILVEVEEVQLLVQHHLREDQHQQTFVPPASACLQHVDQPTSDY